MTRHVNSSLTLNIPPTIRGYVSSQLYIYTVGTVCCSYTFVDGDSRYRNAIIIINVVHVCECSPQEFCCQLFSTFYYNYWSTKRCHKRPDITILQEGWYHIWQNWKYLKSLQRIWYTADVYSKIDQNTNTLFEGSSMMLIKILDKILG